MNIPLLLVLWQHIMYLCVHCFQCREVCGLASPHTSLHRKQRTQTYMICCHNTIMEYS